MPLNVFSTAPAFREVAPGVARLGIVFVNVYFLGEPGGPWVLVDAGLPHSAELTRRAAAERFGGGTPPEAVVLTHGHFDHAGAALELADAWDVPVYAHPRELPYLTGRCDYPPQDPTMGGAIAFMARFFPNDGVDLGGRVEPFPADGRVPGAEGWRWLHTPGHTPGHVSFHREADGVLIAGDALATMDLDAWTEQVLRRRALHRPPAPFTPDWRATRESIGRLAELEPSLIAAGHGLPLAGTDVAERLHRLAPSLAVPPRRTRYVPEPARYHDDGRVASLPPPVPDPLPRRLALGGGVALATALLAAGRRS